jgi:uncharacterized membrane protein SirB2
MLVEYGLLKGVHIGSALISITLFVVRGGWMIKNSARLRQRWVRVAPHVIDTILLLSAFALVWQLGGIKLIATQSWLQAKLTALLAYIALGTIALKRGRTRGVRVVAFVSAITVFGYIVSVAITKSPAGFFGLL